MLRRYEVAEHAYGNKEPTLASVLLLWGIPLVHQAASSVSVKRTARSFFLGNFLEIISHSSYFSIILLFQIKII